MSHKIHSIIMEGIYLITFTIKCYYIDIMFIMLAIVIPDNMAFIHDNVAFNILVIYYIFVNGLNSLFGVICYMFAPQIRFILRSSTWASIRICTQAIIMAAFAFTTPEINHEKEKSSTKRHLMFGYFYVIDVGPFPMHLSRRDAHLPTIYFRSIIDS
ncbi:hypothetical protein ACJX0J_017100, partial [Zea mays]